MLGGIGSIVRETRRMLQQVTKRVRSAWNWPVEFKLAVIEQHERGRRDHGLRETPPSHERLRLWTLRLQR